MPEILLIQPPISDFYLTAKRTIPYGLACLAGPLESRGYSVEILDALAVSRSRKLTLPPEMAYLEDFYPGPDISPFSLFHNFRRFGLGAETIGERARNSGAFLVGVSSLFSAYSAEALQTAKEVKRNCPEAVIVLGGHHPTEMPEEVLRHDWVDFIIRGEAETALPLLAGAIQGGVPMESVPGLGFRSAGKYFIKPPAVLENLDEPAFPAIELIDKCFYQRGRRPCAVISAGRGCPLGCSFCSIGCSSWSSFRLKSVNRVIEEMERSVFGIGARFIDFEDENISCRKQWFLDLLSQIESRFRGCGLELRAMNGLFPPSLDEEIVCAMKDAGFTALNLSLCSTGGEQLQRFRRPDVREELEGCLRYGEKHGLDAVAYIIVGAPGQDPRDSVADLLYLAPRPAIAGVSVFYPAPGSADFEKCRAQNLLPPAVSLFRSTALPVTDKTTRDDSITLLRLGRILNFFKSLDATERNEVLRLAGEQSPTDLGPAFECPDMNGPGLPAVQLPQQYAGAKPGREGEISRRREIGKALLGMFLREGVIYGMSPDGRLFRHRTSDALCREFRSGLKKIFGSMWKPTP